MLYVTPYHKTLDAVVNFEVLYHKNYQSKPKSESTFIIAKFYADFENVNNKILVIHIFRENVSCIFENFSPTCL